MLIIYLFYLTMFVVKSVFRQMIYDANGIVHHGTMQFIQY